MITINDIIKKKQSYQIKINQETIEVEPEVVLKYKIKPMVSMDEKTFQRLLDDQAFYHYRKIGLKKLSRMMTSYEMKTYLMGLDCRDVIIRQIINDFEMKGYLNDAFYVKSYIELKKYSEGPKVLAHRLAEKGILKSLIEEGLKNVDEKEILLALIPQKAKSQKKESKKQMMLKIKTYFIRKGFDLDLVDEIVNYHVEWPNYDVKEVIYREFVKYHKQYAKKYEGYELKKKIVEKLNQKGYQKSEIEHVMLELDSLQIN